MSNFAEFDVPEPSNSEGGKSEKVKEDESKGKDNSQNANVRVGKKGKTKAQPKITISWLLPLLGFIIVSPTVLYTWNLWTKNSIQDPFGGFFTQYNVIIMVISYLLFKLSSSRSFFSKIGLLVVYATVLGYVSYKLYELFTTGQVNWFS